MPFARRTVAVTAATVLLATVAVVAPALSARPYHPEPVAFDIPAPAQGLGKSSARGFVSDEVEAPKRFNLVGFEWEGSSQPAIAIRTRADGEAWSAWTPVPSQPDGAPDPGSEEPGGLGTSEPVWAGEADSVQYRMSRRPPELRLHFVNTSGSATPTDRAATALRGAVNDGVMAVAALASAGAVPNRPDMISRGGWGAESCPPRDEPDIGKVKAAFVHHTVTTNSYSRDQAKSMVLGICYYHRNTRNWDDIGYNFLVDRFGRIFVGRDGGIGKAVVGAHAEGFNDQTVGVAALGNHQSHKLSRRGVRGVAKLIRWKLKHHGNKVGGRATLTSGGGQTNRYPRGAEVRLKRISGHRNVAYTECPGDRLYGQLDRIRRKARS